MGSIVSATAGPSPPSNARRVGASYTEFQTVPDQAEAAAVLADYEHRNRLITPVIRRVLSWLVDLTYDGSDAARQRLVHELPVAAFHPTARV